MMYSVSTRTEHRNYLTSLGLSSNDVDWIVANTVYENELPKEDKQTEENEEVAA